MKITVHTALATAYEILQKAAVPDYPQDARLLLEHVTGLTREVIVGYPETNLEEKYYTAFMALVQRRAAREPLSHLIKKREFWGLEFGVTGDTLDPRPDSETLIEVALKLFPDKQAPLSILDFGTGTGCLLLTLLAQFPNAKGVGVDIHAPALLVAKENSKKLGLEKRVRFLLQYWGEGITDKYNLIITNPPYIKDADIATLQPEVSKYEPRIALAGGEDGLKCYREIAPYLSTLLTDNGFSVIEFGYGQDQEVSRILINHRLKVVSYARDLAGIIRCVTVSPNQ